MAEKTKMRRQLALAAPDLLPAVPVKKKKPQQARASRPFPAVLHVSVWGFLNAGFVALGFVVHLVLRVINPCVPLWMLPPPDEQRDYAAEDATVTALLPAYVCCAVAQAAAATAAMLLGAKRRWIRRELAYVLLAAAVAGHCMYSSALATDPRDPIVFKISYTASIFVFAVGDLLCLLALLVASDE